MAARLRSPLGLLLALAVAVAIALGLLLALPGDSDDDGGGGLAALAEAGERTAKYPGARMRVTGSFAIPGSGVVMTMSGAGAYNGETGRARLTMSSEDLPPEARAQFPEGFEIEEVDELTADSFVMYMRSPAFGELPDGAEWMKVDLSEQAGSAQTADPRDSLRMLRSSESAEILGTETIRGIRTTHYRATIDQNEEVERLRREGEDEAADLLEQVIDINDGEATTEFEVWADADATVHRMAMEMPFGFGAEDATMTMEIDLFDFGIRPSIELPDEDSVFDATELAKEQLEQQAEAD